MGSKSARKLNDLGSPYYTNSNSSNLIKPQKTTATTTPTLGRMGKGVVKPVALRSDLGLPSSLPHNPTPPPNPEQPPQLPQKGGGAGPSIKKRGGSTDPDIN